MGKFKKLTLATAISSAFVLTGCGGSSSSSNDSNDSNDGGTTVSGTATAPGGQIAQFEQQSLFEVAINFVIPPAAAAITGLEPVEGALVELIRVDDNGNQIGDVLATSQTSITGDYQLTLPEGVNLAGNLIVRITGQNNNELRAQVVEQDVDITPMSEFVLRKFIQQGADLDELVVTDVVKLNGKVEEFDLTAGANLDQMFATLEDNVGAFVENEVAAASAPAGDGTSISGNYYSAAITMELSDIDGSGSGELAHEIWLGDFSIADQGDGTVTLAFTQEDLAYGDIYGSSLQTPYIYYEVASETFEDESFPATFNAKGILTVEGEFEEDVYDEGPNGTGTGAKRYPAVTYSFQKVKNTGLLFGLSHEAAIAYGVVYNEDSDTYSLDPNNKNGDDIYRVFEVFSRKPTSLTAANLSGDYGRVWFESSLFGGGIELRTEVNTVTFDGFTVDVAQANVHSLEVNAGGATYNSGTEPAEADVALNIQSDGTIVNEEESMVGFVNDSGNYIDFTGSSGTNQNEAMFEKTMMVKLPASQLNLEGKTYRLMFLAMHFDDAINGTIAIQASQFNTLMTMASATEGSVNGRFSETLKDSGIGSEVEVSVDAVDDMAFEYTIAENGATEITIGSDEGDTVLDGFFNADGSLGVFSTRFMESDTGNADELGLAVLIDVTE
ncbi:hypothetical protein A8B84_10080 [Marinobacter sp. EhC06]|jgi:hypothetical protein|uniref:hypothetical protein n=1 Tax=Marinobacter TaxID=2742 RepID=UPI0007D9577F|nr:MULTISPECIES: hypothetical protein [unclassified Marinobacter]OAN88924.1 hypothetical protein A8B80_08290 [Marinobacter sp. EhN04]OAN91906.1 hypothetical protein A8B84_10080 [Marinobacter sp. EhC06]